MSPCSPSNNHYTIVQVVQTLKKKHPNIPNDSLLPFVSLSLIQHMHNTICIIKILFIVWFWTNWRLSYWLRIRKCNFSLICLLSDTFHLLCIISMTSHPISISLSLKDTFGHLFELGSTDNKAVSFSLLGNFYVFFTSKDIRPGCRILGWSILAMVESFLL